MKAHSELVGLQLAEVAAVADELQERAEAAEAQLHKEVTSRIAVEVRAVRAESLATHRGELASRQGVTLKLTRSCDPCPHAQLGIPETAHGPTLEHRQLPHGSCSHSLTRCATPLGWCACSPYLGVC
jgi:hypothetical protein